MSVLKIALGVVLGLLCWNFLVAWSEQQERVEQQKRLDRAIEAASAECKQTKALEACTRAMKFTNTKLERMVEELKTEHKY